ncbi:MAG: VWA domain-containing protein [bacterium]|nr:VWA domain-containing protein [bacterium]
MRNLITTLALLFGLSAFASPALAQDDIDSLVSELTKLRDDAEPELVQKLAEIGTRDAMESLLELYGKMGSIYMRREIVRGLARFDGVTDAQQPALQKIMDVATTAKERELREGALAALGTCKELGKEFLVMIVESSAQDDIREEALRLHVEQASGEDSAWYTKLFEKQPELVGAKKKSTKKGKARKKKDGEGAEGEKRVHQLQGVREIAFGQIVRGMDDAAVIKVFEEDRSQDIRLLALDDLQRRGAKDVEKLAREVFERIDGRGTDRAHAARVLADIEGPRIASEFVDLAKKRDVTPDVMRRVMADVLAEMKDEGVNKLVSKMIGRGKPHEKVFALRAARNISDPKLIKKIRKGLKDKDRNVVIMTAELLGARKDREALDTMEKIISKSKDEELVAQVVDAMSEIHDGTNEWVDKLKGYVGGESREMRNAALIQLGSLENTAHIPMLVENLAHTDWSTRFAALKGLQGMRKKEAIGPIIERMSEEYGRMLHEFADVLWALTGQPYRTRAQAWKGWWEKEGESFAVISESDLDKRAQEEEDRRLRMVSNVEFFGIRIVSHRVIFIIDISGSMLENLRGEYVGQSGEARIDVAKRELAKCVEGLDANALFNMVTFSTGVTSWLDTGIAGSNEKTREEALGYIDRLGANGGTNLYGAVQAAFEDPDVDTIFVLSDGEPTVGDVTDPFRIREDVKRWNEHRGIEIHTIAVGGALQVLEWLAEDSGGTHVKFH